jgi:hypothetical protein
MNCSHKCEDPGERDRPSGEWSGHEVLRSLKIRHQEWKVNLSNDGTSKTAVRGPFQFSYSVFFVGTNRSQKSGDTLAIGMYSGLDAWAVSATTERQDFVADLELVKHTPRIEELALARILICPRENVIGIRHFDNERPKLREEKFGSSQVGKHTLDGVFINGVTLANVVVSHSL